MMDNNEPTLYQLLTDHFNELYKIADSGEREDAAWAATEAKEMLDAVKSLVEMVNGKVMQKIPPGSPVRLPDGRILEHKVGQERRKWRHSEIKRDIIKRLIQVNSDPDTGELDTPVEDLLLSVLDFPSVSAWKVTSLKTLDISADDYCDVNPPRESIVITKSKEG